jgi:hypothetical protein
MTLDGASRVDCPGIIRRMERFVGAVGATLSVADAFVAAHCTLLGGGGLS